MVAVEDRSVYGWGRADYGQLGQHLTCSKPTGQGSLLQASGTAGQGHHVQDMGERKDQDSASCTSELPSWTSLPLEIPQLKGAQQVE